MRIEMEDGTFVNTDNATKRFSEATGWDGKNTVSLATGNQWVHQTLFLSKKGRWYIGIDSQWQGSKSHAEYVEPVDAARWLLKNNYSAKDIPSELSKYISEIEE